MPAGVAPGSGQSYKDNGGQMVRPRGPCIWIKQFVENFFFFLGISSRMPLETGGLQ